MSSSLYCNRCMEIRPSPNLSVIDTENNTTLISGNCFYCGKFNTRYVDHLQLAQDQSEIKTGGDLVGVLNTVSRNFQLPLQKFPGELHLPGMNFAGPGTRLEYRLNDDGTYKEFSKPIDRVDEAAYYHDLAYNEYKDTENRNIADREMLKDLSEIKNPSIREKIEMAIIKPIINTKQKFGLGLKDRMARNFQLVASKRNNSR